MPRGDHSTSISLCIILLFIPFLNSSTRALLSYLLHLATLLNIWTNLFIIQESCFSYSSFTTFVDSLSPLLNSLFNAASSSPTNRNSQSLIQNLLKCSLSTYLPILSTHTLRLSGMVHTGVKVCRMDSEMSGLVERPWLQLMCCTVCLPHGHNFR